MDNTTGTRQSLFCCYLPCMMYMKKDRDNITQKGIKKGLPYYECSTCRNSFDLGEVIRLENNATGIKGNIVFSIIFALTVIFIINISVLAKIFLLLIPLTLLIVAGIKINRIYGTLNLYRNERGAILTVEQENRLNEKYEKARLSLQDRVI